MERSMMLNLLSYKGILLLFSVLLFAYSSVGNSDLPALRVAEYSRNREFVEVVEPWKTKRHLAEETGGNSSLLLAEKRTQRKDPLDHFKRYEWGWNIKNQHYWASVGFTAAPFFVIAAIWFIAFGLSLSLLCCCYCCCRREPYGYSRIAYALSLIFLILFTIAAIVGCIVLYTGQGRFHNHTRSTLDYVVDQANDTVESLMSVSDYLSAAKHIGVNSVFLPTDVQTQIDTLETKIHSSATVLSDKTERNSKDIQTVLNNVRVALIVLAAVMLLLAFLASKSHLRYHVQNAVFSVLGVQCLVYFFVVLGWILVTGTFILCGVFLLLHNVIADTCVAMDEWVQNPTAHTTLDDIIPCVDNATAQETLLQSKNVTYQIVSIVNGVITNVSNVNVLPTMRPLYYNQSGPLVPILCNPFYHNLADRKCAEGEVELSNATEVWKSYVCQVSASGICTTQGRLTPNYYDQMSAAVNTSYGLYRYGPFLVGLEDCTFVRETFTNISSSYCPGLRRYSKWIYAGLVLVSVAVMLSLIFWVIYARERRHRVHAKQFTSRGG